MTTQFPPANVPANMQPFARAVENSIAITEGSQDNTGNIIRSMRQGIASNYGLGQTLTNNAGNIADKVHTSLHNAQGTLSSTRPLQRTWTDFGDALNLTSAPFTSNVSLAVSAAAYRDVTGGDPGATYSHWLRINITGGVTGNKFISRTDYGQTLFFWDNVPASSSITLKLQIWGFIHNPDNTYEDGILETASIVRISAAQRAIALV